VTKEGVVVGVGEVEGSVARVGQLLISKILESATGHGSLQSEKSLVDVLPLGAALDPAQPLARSLSFLVCGEPVPFAPPVGITEIIVRGQAQDSGFGLKNDFASTNR
jgi:hypothetical protein